MTASIFVHRPNGVPVEVKAQVVRLLPASYGTQRIGVAIDEPKESWLRLFVAWIADDNIVAESMNKIRTACVSGRLNC